MSINQKKLEKFVDISTPHPYSKGDLLVKARQKIEFDKYVTPENQQTNPFSEQKESNPALTYLPKIGITYNSETQSLERTKKFKQSTGKSAFPEYTPTDEAIQCINSYSPLIEVSNRLGYWNYVLSESGAEVVTFTDNPLGRIDTDLLIKVRKLRLNDDEKLHTKEIPYSDARTKVAIKQLASGKTVTQPPIPWSKIQIGGFALLNEYPNHTILATSEIRSLSLDIFNYISSGQKLIIFLEWTVENYLRNSIYQNVHDWKLVDSFPLYTWKNDNTAGYVFEKP